MKVDNKLDTARLIAESLTSYGVERWQKNRLTLGQRHSLSEAVCILEEYGQEVAFVGKVVPTAQIIIIFLIMVGIGITIFRDPTAGIVFLLILFAVCVLLGKKLKSKFEPSDIAAAQSIVDMFLADADGLNPILFEKVDIVFRRAACEQANVRKYLGTCAMYLQSTQHEFDRAKAAPGRNLEELRGAVNTLMWQEERFAASLKAHVERFQILDVTREDIFADVEKAQRAAAARSAT